MDATNLIPDLAEPVQARKIRAPKHDFDDGQGKVFAHRHSNGNGWVADTARVDESVKVASGCEVFGVARVTDTVELTGKAKIGDHARVMNNVRMSGNAFVRGSALVRDSVRLSGNTFVSGQAHLSGTTNTEGRVYISDFALLHNSRCIGPHKSYHLEIGNNARIFDCQLRGVTSAFGTVIAQSAQLYNCRCLGTATIFGSLVSTTVDGELSRVMWRGRARRRMPETNEAAEGAAPSLAGRVIVVRGIIVNSQLNMRPCVVSERAYVLECNLDLYNQDTAQFFPEFPAGPIAGLNTAQINELPAYYTRGTARAAATHGIPAISSVGAVPPPELRQRRIMRMEEATT